MQLLPIHSFFLRTKKGKSFRVVLFHFKKKEEKTNGDEMVNPRKKKMECLF